MALLALNRKKQALAPDVRELVKSLTGFEKEEQIRECENYVFSNFLHYQQPMVEGAQVQRSIDGLIQKFTLHGFPQKGKRLKTLVETFKGSTLFNDHMQTGVEWYILQLMVNLAYKPTFTTVDDNPLPLSPLPAVSTEELFDWGAYLKEGWEDYQLPDEDEISDESWSSSDEEPLFKPEDEKKELVIHSINRKDMKYRGSEPVYISSIPNPCTWKKKTPPAETKQEALVKIIRDSKHSKLWLKDNVQNSWWKDSSFKENVTCKLKSANFSETWKVIEKQKINSVIDNAEYKVMSEYKVLREILWMFQVPTNTVLFFLDENGNHKVNGNVTIPSVTQGSLQQVLSALCPYFDQVHDLKKFRRSLKQGEEEDKPPPYTYKAFCVALFEELANFTQFVVEIEKSVDKQDQSITIVSLMIDLEPGLLRLKCLHEIYKTCVTDWRSQPCWVGSTRLLSKLYSILLTPTNNMHLSIALHLFIASFSVYLNIIDIWLREGQLEDWRQEFLVGRNGEELYVMPYDDEMKKYCIDPVSLLSKLVHMVRDAGRSMTHIIKLDKLHVLRKAAHNKGNLYNEFVDNVNEELRNIHISIYNSSSVGFNVDNEAEDVLVQKKITELSKDVINASCITKDTDSVSDVIEVEYSSRKKDKLVNTTMCEDKITVDKTMHQLTTKQLIDNPFLNEIFEEYLKDTNEDTVQDKYGTSVHIKLYSDEILDMLSVHQILEKQLQLVYNRHALSAKIVTETLISDYHLIEHFIVLRKVLLMEAGNLIQNFYSFLFKEMAARNCRNARGLTMQLVLCIEEEYPELGANFSVKIKDEDDSNKTRTPITDICNISIGYTVEWPVSMVISKDSIVSYNSIFSFLLCIKYAFWSLHNLKFTDLNQTVENVLLLRRLFVLKMWIQHCVTTIHFYFMGHVLHDYTTSLEETVKQARFIDDIINAHNKFLNAVREHCLQKTPSKLKQIILQMLELSPMLVSLWRLGTEGKLTEDNISQLEDKYIKTHHAFSLILEHIIENSSELSINIGHLTELSSEISSSLPERAITRL